MNIYKSDIRFNVSSGNRALKVCPLILLDVEYCIL